MGQLDGVADVPAFERVGGDLRMKLKSQRECSDGESLVRILRGTCKVDRTRRNIERVAVPMQNLHLVLQHRGQRVCGAGAAGYGTEGRPADFLAVGAGSHPRAKCRGHELRAETDSEGRPFGREPVPDDLQLVFQERILLLFVNTDRASENHQEVGGCLPGARQVGDTCLENFYFETGGSKGRLEGAQIFKENMLEDQCALH